MRIVFLGTPEFAVPTLQGLVHQGHDVAAVYTQPDRPKGRGNLLAESAVKQAALALELPVYQPERIRRADNLEALRNFAADVMVVVGYGQIIPQSIIDLPAQGILNVHASLLPKYRGAAPIQWAIANGEATTGVTIMQIDAGLDTGDMLLKASVPIDADQTAPELSAVLAPLGARLLLDVLKQMTEGSLVREKQRDSEATLAPILKKEDGRVDWLSPAKKVHDRLRGFTPWPGAYTSFRGQKLSLLSARIAEGIGAAPALIKIENRRLLVGCGDGTVLELLEVQLEGKKRSTADAFLNGYKPAANERLGESDFEESH